MKFTCDQQTLSKAINTVSKAVTNRTTIPILKGILLKCTSDGKLTLTASDLDLSIEKTMDAHVEKPGSLVVLSRLFGDIIRKMPAGNIFIEEMENNNLLIKTSFSEFTIVGLPVDEFPNIGELEETSKNVFLDKETFKNMIRKTAFSASVDESKGIIVGVLIEMEKESINMVALDGFRMAVAREKLENNEEKKIIISAKIMNEINKIIAETDGIEDINIILSEKKAVILLNDTKVISRLLEGEFIKYKDIIPKESKCKIKVNRKNILESIERASLLAKEGKNNLIKLMTGGSNLTITSRSEEGNVKEDIAIERTGIDLEIGFNSKYVMDVLKALEDEEVVMEFTTSVSPCLIKPTEGNSFEYLVLPVRITS